MRIELPISKSIANRLLILQAIHGDELMPVSVAMPDDVLILHTALSACKLQNEEVLTIDIGNCGTAARFLTAYLAQRENKVVVLQGVERMHHRPIGQLVETLQKIGADIEYVGEIGYLPLRIKGKRLDKNQVVTLNDPLSSQFISALMLIGVNVQTNSTSPYINITREIISDYQVLSNGYLIERDWSSAAFWYEYVAIHGGKIELEGLLKDSVQGDKVVAEIFQQLGVNTEYLKDGIRITKVSCSHDRQMHIDFENCPDLYPALAITCERLGIELHATGTESLSIKESDRLSAVREHRTDHDHRMAMALLVAGYPIDDASCIRKSYPEFMEQWDKFLKTKYTIVVPRRGINDEGKGKKHALYRLISEAKTDYVWMQDDDITFETTSLLNVRPLPLLDFDLLILPLRMESESEHPSLLERLQIAEYAAIQQLTIDSAKRKKAVMCSGANLIARRDRWLESYEDLHPEIPSGDDMFLLESFKRRGLKIAVCEDEALTAIVRPHTSWKAFFKQRMRWAGKAPKYTDRDILRSGLMILLANILQLICPLVLIVKFPLEYKLIKKRDNSIRLSTALLLAIVYPLYILTCIVGGLIRREW